MPSKINNAFWCYCGSEERLRQIAEEAGKIGCGKSKYLMMTEEEFRMSRARQESSNPQDVQLLKEELAKLKKDLREADRLTAVQDELIQSLRNQLPIQSFNAELIAAIQKGPIHDRKLMEALGIDLSNGEAIRAVSRQLEVLEANGMITKTARGWTWKA
jgi:hypothetical protein